MFEGGAFVDVESDVYSPALRDQRWSEYEPSGLTMDMLTVVGGQSLNADQCLEAIVGWERLIAFAQARQLREIARFGELRPGTEPGTGAALAADEIAAELQLTRVAANHRLATAQALTQRLPATLDALTSGEIDLRKAQAVCDETWTLSDEQAATVESRVLDRAAARDVSTISWWRTALRRAVLRADPVGAERRHQLRKTERRVVVTPAADGMAELWALLPAPDAVAIHRKLGVLARGARSDGDGRTMDQRRADCLVDLLLGRAAGAVDVQVQVTVAAGTLLEQDDLPAELAGYGPITAGQARELAAEGTWRRLLTDPASGALLDYGRTTYRPPKALADHVRARDRHCTFPRLPPTRRPVRPRPPGAVSTGWHCRLEPRRGLPPPPQPEDPRRVDRRSVRARGGRLDQPDGAEVPGEARAVGGGGHRRLLSAPAARRTGSTAGLGRSSRAVSIAPAVRTLRE